MGEARRLNSWKEIAGYLDRGVRTVQRYEQELGLPVHRLEGFKRDVVFAFAEEIDAWLEAHSHLLHEEPREKADGQSFTSRWAARLGPLGAGLALAFLVVALLYGGYHAYLHLTATPADYRVEERAVIVLDQYGRELWRHNFRVPLNDVYQIRPPAYRYPYAPRQVAALEDLDGDGHAELLFGVSTDPEHQTKSKFYCFDRRGRILWSYQPTRTIDYGDHERPGDHQFEPPYNFGAFFLFSGREAPPDAIWAIFHRAPWFPSVVVKLNARGEVLGEYWHAGAVNVLAEATLAPPGSVGPGLGGRRVVLAGGYSNECRCPALSVLDYDDPSGFSPAENPAYLCTNCPAGEPLAYVHFPRTELAQTLDEYERIHRNFKLLYIGLRPAYTTFHNKLMTEGVLDHPVDVEKERRELGVPVFWNGARFTADWRGLAPATAAQVSDQGRNPE